MEQDKPDSTSDHTRASLERRLGQLRPRLLAFARLQLADAGQVEDMVQETLVSALESLEGFKGQAKFETWVFGILRHKLVDTIRRRGRDVVAEYDANELADIDDMFNPRAHWAVGAQPDVWRQPESSCERDHFWEAFDLCVFHLPRSSAQVFTMRELMGLETREICDSLAISEQNCWVILHRTRLKLRACLEAGWFSKAEVS